MKRKYIFMVKKCNLKKLILIQTIIDIANCAGTNLPIITIVCRKAITKKKAKVGYAKIALTNFKVCLVGKIQKIEHQAIKAILTLLTIQATTLSRKLASAQF